MNRILVIMLLAGLTSCFNPPPLKTGLEGTKLPSFSLLLKDSITKFDTNKLPNGKAVIMFYFSPSCPYCRAQTEAIIANIKYLKDVEVCLLTPGPFLEFTNFYKEYHLEKYNNIMAGIDYDNSFGTYFKIQVVPYIAIYNNNKILKQVLIGKVGINKIRDIATD